MPGLQSGTALVLLAELGPDFAERFPTAKHFGLWLELSPDNRITGGRIYSVRTQDVKSRVTEALLLAAQSLHRAQNYFRDLYRRWQARQGSPLPSALRAGMILGEQTCKMSVLTGLRRKY